MSLDSGGACLLFCFLCNCSLARPRHRPDKVSSALIDLMNTTPCKNRKASTKLEAAVGAACSSLSQQRYRYTTGSVTCSGERRWLVHHLAYRHREDIRFTNVEVALGAKESENDCATMLSSVRVPAAVSSEEPSWVVGGSNKIRVRAFKRMHRLMDSSLCAKDVMRSLLATNSGVDCTRGPEASSLDGVGPCIASARPNIVYPGGWRCAGLNTLKMGEVCHGSLGSDCLCALARCRFMCWEKLSLPKLGMATAGKESPPCPSAESIRFPVSGATHASYSPSEAMAESKIGKSSAPNPGPSQTACWKSSESIWFACSVSDSTSMASLCAG